MFNREWLQLNSKFAHQLTAVVKVCLPCGSEKEMVCAPHAAQSGSYGPAPYRMSEQM